VSIIAKAKAAKAVRSRALHALKNLFASLLRPRALMLYVLLSLA
jgi:hypothetical protein